MAKQKAADTSRINNKKSINNKTESFADNQSGAEETAEIGGERSAKKKNKDDLTSSSDDNVHSDDEEYNHDDDGEYTFEEDVPEALLDQGASEDTSWQFI